jgi:tetratricopeptide (TPR) repeat protein
MNGRSDWFRNKHWNAEIENAFFQKLARARDKAQYLRIQACELAPHEPDVALRLLDQYFALNDNSDHAQAHVDRATAFLALGNIEAAVSAYEAALAHEAEFPSRRSRAQLDLPYLIARKSLSAYYDRALELLEKRKEDLMFPVDHFQWHCSRAFILSERANRSSARDAAQAALAATGVPHSGFRYHPELGLANNVDPALIRRLKTLV